MTDRIQLQTRLLGIAREIDSNAAVKYAFDDAAFTVLAPDRRDVPLSEEFVADRSDREIAEELQRRWNLET